MASLRSRSAHRLSAAWRAFLTSSVSIITRRPKGSLACSTRKASVTRARKSRTWIQKRGPTATSLLLRRSERRRSWSISYETASTSPSATWVREAAWV